MTYADTVKFFVAMVIMMNPLGSLTVFLDLNHRVKVKQQRKIAINCGVSIFIIMLVSLWFGHEILDLLGITIDSFRFAGGIILLLIGLSMLQSRVSPVTHTPEDDAAAGERESIAIVPMALPTIVGPGSISTLVLASTDYPLLPQKLWLSLICFALSLGMFLILYYGTSIAHFVGTAVIKVITRIMGMIIMAIAVGMLANGLIGLIPALG